MKKWKRSLTILLVAVLIMSMIPVPTYAATKKGKVKSITVTSTPANILVVKKGQKYKLKVSVKTTGKISKKVTYTTSNPKIATVSKSGRVKGIKKGTTKLTVKSVANPKVKKTIKVKVGTPVKKVKVTQKSVSMEAGKTYQIKTMLTPKKPTYKKLSYASSNEAVAKVSKKGVVTAYAAGKATITVKSLDGSNKKAKCVITVTGETEDGKTEDGKKTDTSVSADSVNPSGNQNVEDKNTEDGKNPTGDDSNVTNPDDGKNPTGDDSNVTNPDDGKNPSGDDSNVTNPDDGKNPTGDDSNVTNPDDGKNPTGDDSNVTNPDDGKNPTGDDSDVTNPDDGKNPSGDDSNVSNPDDGKNPTGDDSNVTNPDDGKNPTGDDSGVTNPDDGKNPSGDDSGVTNPDDGKNPSGDDSGTTNPDDGTGTDDENGKDDAIAVTGITLDQTEATVEVGSSVNLIPTVLPENATDQTISWTSSDETVATVKNGTVTGIKEGSAVITVSTSNDIKATCNITVTAVEGEIEAESVSLDTMMVYTEPGLTVSLTATVAPENTTNKAVSYTSNDTAIATVDSNGLVTAKASGTAIVTVQTENGKTAFCEVRVAEVGDPSKERLATGITLDRETAVIEVGEYLPLGAYVVPNNATRQSVSYKSDDMSVAKVSYLGAIKGIAPGTATISAITTNGFVATCVVTVVEKNVETTAVTLNKSEVSLLEGDSLALQATVLPLNATNTSVTFQSSDSAVLTVNEKGRMTAGKPGSATITVKTANGKTATCAVTVGAKAEAVLPTSISVNKSAMTLNLYGQQALFATVLPENATDKTVSWTTSDASVAIVSKKGTVLALKAGTAIITATTVNGKSVTCTVAVKGKFVLPSDQTEVVNPVDESNMFDAPYISTYYFNPKPSAEESIQIPLYLTNCEQSEYINEDTTKKLDLLYEVDGVKKTISDLPLGDYTLTLGKLEKGLHTFSVQVLDKTTGLKSHKLYNDLWVVDSSAISEEETYYMTLEDLETYEIHNDDSEDETDVITTRDGLTKLFADKQAEGYRKLVLLQGTYRVYGENGREKCIAIPSFFTVDMNGSTFKLDTVKSDFGKAENEANTIGCLVRFSEVTDAHLMNGTLIGDRFERQDLYLEKDCYGEADNTVLFNGGKYCSITGLTIKNTTGHTVFTSAVYGPAEMMKSYSKNQAIINGQEKTVEGCITSEMLDLSKILAWNENERHLYVGHPYGYRGVKSDSALVYVSFYDENQDFLQTVTGYQYRRLEIPAGAKYARVTMNGENKISTVRNNGDTVYVYAKHFGSYHEFSNLDFMNTRTTAMSPSNFENLLIENCTYTRVGCSITPSIMDLEDGWEEAQDLYYRNNEVLEKARTSTTTIIDNTGFNHVYENVVNHDFTIRYRVTGCVIRNIDDGKSIIGWSVGTKKQGTYSRIYNNNVNHIAFTTQNSNSELCTDIRVKDCTIVNASTYSMTTGVKEKVVFERCNFPCFSGANAVFKNCTITPGGQIRDNLHFYNCTFLESIKKINLSKLQNANRTFDHCTFKGQTKLDNYGMVSGTFRDCDFEDLRLIACMDAWDETILFEDCNITSSGNDFVHVGPFTYSDPTKLNVIFRNCEITHKGQNLIYFDSKPSGDSQILFDQCTVNMEQGNLTKWSVSDLDRFMDRISIDIKFVGTQINKDLVVDSRVDAQKARISYE